MVAQAPFSTWKHSEKCSNPPFDYSSVSLAVSKAYNAKPNRRELVWYSCLITKLQPKKREKESSEPARNVQNLVFGRISAMRRVKNQTFPLQKVKLSHRAEIAVQLNGLLLCCLSNASSSEILCSHLNLSRRLDKSKEPLAFN